jgi:hypothetical protein
VLQASCILEMVCDKSGCRSGDAAPRGTGPVPTRLKDLLGGDSALLGAVPLRFGGLIVELCVEALSSLVSRLVPFG